MLDLSFSFDLADLELHKASLPLDFLNHGTEAVMNMASAVTQARG